MIHRGRWNRLARTYVVAETRDELLGGNADRRLVSTMYGVIELGFKSCGEADIMLSLISCGIRYVCMERS